MSEGIFYCDECGGDTGLAPCEYAKLQSQLAILREALIIIAKTNFAGPSTDERREFTWATATKAIDALKKCFGEKDE